MQTFKKFTLYVLSIVLVVALLSAAFIVPWLSTPTDYHDQKLRDKLAGKIDTLIIGQSYAMNGILPGRLDKKLGTFTYNLSGSLMPIYGQKYMLEKEMERNPVKHVIIEITPDTFTTDERMTYGNGDSYIIARLPSFADRLNYLIECVQPSDWPNIYARMLLQSMRSAANRLLGKMELIDESYMGFTPLKVKDVSRDLDTARAQHRSMSIFHEPRKENIAIYEEMIAFCQQKGCDVTIVYTPISHFKVWQLYDQDVFLSWARELAAKYDVPLFDFNLLKSRHTLFSDQSSFSDDSHLCLDGAEVFSDTMADILLRYRQGEDVSSLFYSSYDEVIHDSIYWGRE